MLKVRDLRRAVAIASVAATLSAALVGPLAAQAAEHDQEKPHRLSWSFAGPLGKFDRAQLQRGLKVYREVCQACHSMSLVPFRALAQPGGPEFTPAQAAAVAKDYKIKDGPNDAGEMFERDGRLADRFPPPFPNEAAARAANNGAAPPDMSVLAKARSYERGLLLFFADIATAYQEQGPDYITALLNGYEETPQGVELPPGTYYNKIFPGHAISMPKPINDGQVEYTDGTPTTVEQYGKDVSAFLMWAAEPHLEDRKRIGLQAVIFLLIFSLLLYFVKRRVWAGIPGHV